MFQDLIFGVRMLLKQPAFTLIAVLTLALGISANTAIFSVVNTLLFRPLPFREPERLVWIANTGKSGLSGATSRVSNFADWRKTNQSFEDLGAYFAFYDYGSYTMIGTGEPERLVGVGVSQNFLDVLGVQPQLGRNFDAEESKWKGRQAVLLNHNFWERRFGADPNIVGQTITLNNDPTTIIGVMPASFNFASVFTPGAKIDMLTPFPISQETDRWGNTLAVIGRLKPGATIQQAQTEFDLLNQQLKQSHPERGTGFGARMTGLQNQVSGRFRQALLVLFGAVGCVLLIACTNLANLLLARATSRRKEIAVRIALGANRFRLIRQMLTESVLLSFCGAAVGLPLAVFATRTLASTQSINLPLLNSVRVDGAALIFTLVITLLTGLIFGLAPALQLSGADFHEDLKESSRGSSEGKRGGWMRGTLVVSEIALAFVLLTGAGLLIRSFLQLLDVDPGFQASHAAAWSIQTSQKYAIPEQRKIFLKELIQKIEAIPGVQSAGLTDALPLGRNRSWGAGAKGETYQPGQYPVAFPRIVDRGYIQAMGIRLRSGRHFTELDNSENEKVIIINETLANRLWPGRDAIGQQLTTGGRDLWQRVIGVVGNVRHSALEEEGSAEMYLPLTQYQDGGAFELVVRANVTPESLAPSVRAAIHSLDPGVPASEFKTLDQIVAQSVSPRRFMTLLLGMFSALALILASLGIYGVISYAVSQRVHEIGIRMALGAQVADVLKMILKQGMKLAIGGVAIGLMASFALTRLMKNLLYSVSATDPLTFGVIALLLTLVALAACFIPARRATKIDPMIALRYE